MGNLIHVHVGQCRDGGSPKLEVNKPERLCSVNDLYYALLPTAPTPDLLAGVSTINQPTTNRPTDTCTIVKAFDVHCTYTCSKIHYI